MPFLYALLCGQKFYSCKKRVLHGMRWMKMHKALLDIYARLVHLDSPMSSKVTLHLPVMTHL
jgi:hypothetical protein